MDCNCRYFTSTAGFLLEGTPYTCCCWQLVSHDPNAPPEKITMTINHPQIKSTKQLVVLFSGWILDTMKILISKLKRKLKQKIGWFVWTVFLSLPWLLSFCGWSTTHSSKNSQTQTRRCLQKKFNSILAEEMIDNSYNDPGQGTWWPRL